jgi:hypothetical protein
VFFVVAVTTGDFLLFSEARVAVTTLVSEEAERSVQQGKQRFFFSSAYAFRSLRLAVSNTSPYPLALTLILTLTRTLALTLARTLTREPILALTRALTLTRT